MMTKLAGLNTDSDCQYLHWLKSDLDYYSYASNIHLKAAGIEEEVIKKVLKHLLKRDATTEDAKKCKMVFRDGEPNKYTFLYEDLVLGYVERKFEGICYNVTFTPYKY